MSWFMHAPNNHGDGEAPLFIAVVGTGEHEEYKGQQNKPNIYSLLMSCPSYLLHGAVSLVYTG